MIILWGLIGAKLKIYVFYLHYYIQMWVAYSSHSFICLVLMIIEGLCIFCHELGCATGNIKILLVMDTSIWLHRCERIE